MEEEITGGGLTEDEMDILSGIFHIIDEILISIDKRGGYIDILDRSDLFTIAEKLGIEYK